MKTASPKRGSASTADAYPHRWTVLIATCLALFMVLLDSTIVNVSIPAIADGLGATFAQAEWVLNAYTLVFAAMLVTFGRLGDMFGRKRFFITGLVTFGVGSLLCGLASTAAFLVAARVVQALGAAFMMPATLSLTAVNFPPEQRGLAMGIWGAVSGVGSAVGPTLGGVLTDAFSWHYIFFINLPIVLIAIALSLKVIPESRDESPHTVDWLGALLSAGLLASLCYALIEGQSIGWTNTTTLTYFGAAAVLFVLFLLQERRAAEPIVDLRLFRNVGFSAGNVTGAVLMFGMMGMFFLLPVYMQAQLGYSATQTGLAMLPMSAAILVSAPLAGRLSDKIGSRWIVFTGMLATAVAVFWLSFLPFGAGWQWLASPLVVAGLGMGLVMPAMTSAVMAVAPKGEEGAASGVLSTMRQVGSVFGVALLAAVFASAMTTAIVDAVPDVPGLPAEAVPYVTEVIEGSSSMMGASMDMETLQEAVPAEALLPLIEGAVSDAAADTLPEPAREMVVEAVMAEVAKGTSMDGTAMMTALTPLVEQVAAAGIEVDGSAWANFGMTVGSKIEQAFAGLGEGFAQAASEGFVLGIRAAFRIGAAFLALGALLALLLRPGKNVGPQLEAMHAA